MDAPRHGKVFRGMSLRPFTLLNCLWWLLATCHCDMHCVDWHLQASPFLDWLVFGKVKRNLGGRMNLCISGAAPLSRKVEEDLAVALCCPIVQVRMTHDGNCIVGLHQVCGMRRPWCPFDITVRF